MKHAFECNSSFFVCLVDYEKAFDSVHRETLQKIMKSFRIPLNLVKMVKKMYDANQCAIRSIVLVKLIGLMGNMVQSKDVTCRGSCFFLSSIGSREKQFKVLTPVSDGSCR